MRFCLWDSITCSVNVALVSLILSSGPRREKTCLRGSDKARFKPVSSATETNKKIEISPVHVARLHMILSKKTNNKGADQTARMRRLVCTCVVRKPPKAGFLTSWPK